MNTTESHPRSMWLSGDFSQISRYGAAAAARLIQGLSITPGARVLDVACGTGNFALPAAALGAIVTGIDIAGDSIVHARSRADAERLSVQFDVGSAEALPYADGQFDVVLGLFGAMFAPRPHNVAAELARVCRADGTIAMANWTPTGFFGDMFQLNGRYRPRRVNPPNHWGQEQSVEELLTPYVSRVRMTRRVFPYEFPFAPSKVAELFRMHFGPTITLLSSLSEQERLDYERDFEELWRKHNEGGADATSVPAEYLEVVATRATATMAATRTP